MIKEFRKFIMQGDLVEIAVAFVIGAAFALVTKAFTTFITDFLAAILGGKVSFDQLSVSIRGTKVFYGPVFTALFNFLLIALVLFFVIKAYNAAKSKFVTPEEEEAEEQIQLLREIRDALTSTS
ncbi:MAG: large conductance mechanosensitive channel protein MscL [Acidimicrobiia bacterium]